MGKARQRQEKYSPDWLWKIPGLIESAREQCAISEEIHRSKFWALLEGSADKLDDGVVHAIELDLIEKILQRRHPIKERSSLDDDSLKQIAVQGWEMQVAIWDFGNEARRLLERWQDLGGGEETEALLQQIIVRTQGQKPLSRRELMKRVRLSLEHRKRRRKGWDPGGRNLDPLTKVMFVYDAKFLEPLIPAERHRLIALMAGEFFAHETTADNVRIRLYELRRRRGMARNELPPD